MTYRILLSKIANGRAPDTVLLDDYDEIGVTEAATRGEAVHYLLLRSRYGKKDALKYDSKYNLELYGMYDLREFKPGDILVEEDLSAYILTPQFQWSKVTLK